MIEIVRVGPFRDVSVRDKNATVTGYFARNQPIERFSEGVRDENAFSLVLRHFWWKILH